VSATVKQSTFIPGLLLGLCAGIALTLVGLYFFLGVGSWRHSEVRADADLLKDEVSILERIRAEGAVGPLTALEERLDSAIVVLGNQISQSPELVTPEVAGALKQAADYRTRYPYRSAPELAVPVEEALALAGGTQ
jgi:hypothetical protein